MNPPSPKIRYSGSAGEKNNTLVHVYGDFLSSCNAESKSVECHLHALLRCSVYIDLRGRVLFVDENLMFLLCCIFFLLSM